MLATIDQVLDDDALFCAVKVDLARRSPHSGTRGRPSTPVEVILRLLVVRRLYDWSYEDTERFVWDSLSLRHFCRAPRVVATDRGGYAPGNEEALQHLGVKRVVIPVPGKPPPERKALEQSRWFRAGQRFRTGIEGRISVCKRRGWLGRCRDHGQEGFARWIGWGVIANNLVAIAAHEATKVQETAA